MSKEDFKQCSQEELVQLFRDQFRNEDDHSICFFLGAGASVSSGIKSGNRMAREWFEELNETKSGQKRLEKIGANKGNVSEKYSELFAQRFELLPDTGLKYLRNEIEGKKHSIGYDYLAQILSKGLHNIVITTNFDRLIEDALFNHAEKAPLVCGHELLSDFIEPNQSRPIVIKLHHDILLGPKNTIDELLNISESFATVLYSILSQHPMVVIGYSGNDESVTDFLNNRDDEISQPIYWCCLEGENVNENVKSLLKKQDFLVTIKGFDELMRALSEVYDLIQFDGTIQVGTLPSIKNSMLHALDIIERFSSMTSDINDAYVNAIKEFDTAELRNKYALFLQNRLNEHDIAGIHFKHCVEAAHNIAEYNFNYARHLHKFSNANNQKAEEFYKKAIALDVKNGDFNLGYAIFLHEEQNIDLAEYYFKKALAVDKYNPSYNYEYANFLRSAKQSEEKIKRFFLLAIEFEPWNAEFLWSYACFLDNNVRNDTEAPSFFRKALDSDDSKVKYNVSYAKCLLLSGDYTKAHSYLLRAIELIESTTDNSELLLEVRFYLTAYFPDESALDLEKAENLLKANKGLQLKNKNFQEHISNLEANEDSNIEDLIILADLITDHTHYSLKNEIIEAAE